MKRNPFHSILTLMIGASTIAGSFAIASSAQAYSVSESAVDPSLLPIGTEINGIRYWSLSEMQEASRLIGNKRSEVCNNDKRCEEDLSYQQMEEIGGIYRALEPFDHIRLVLSSINPSLGTIKLFYQDEDKMLSSMLGETVRSDISSILLVWVDESLIGNPYTDVRWLAYDYRYPFHLGTEEETAPATHIVLDESSAELGAGWFTPNVEREYDISGSEIALNSKGLIYFTYLSDESGRSIGPMNYSSCITSESYAEGMECRIMYSENSSYTFIPFAAESNVPKGADPIALSSVEDESTSDPTISKIATESPSSRPSDQMTNQTSPSSSSKLPVSAVTTPNTGVETHEKGTIAELPWWLGVIFAVGLTTLIWFLAPNHKKSSKKSPKTIDKVSQVW